MVEEELSAHEEEGEVVHRPKEDEEARRVDESVPDRYEPCGLVLFH